MRLQNMPPKEELACFPPFVLFTGRNVVPSVLTDNV